MSASTVDDRFREAFEELMKKSGVNGYLPEGEYYFKAMSWTDEMDGIGGYPGRLERNITIDLVVLPKTVTFRRENARREYDFESDAEEVKAEIGGPRKELESGD